ncbi:MAG: penicillin-binding protein activator [Bdellovibrionales bacterium CG10_big_fil_rev_8_21_14_0_10_45_34]|nr:MAG: penicillin-binding protein activator [Bdellovibrionales bacterium CG10_big_fil_rev_8_21_14_0_10_45_34]
MTLNNILKWFRLSILIFLIAGCQSTPKVEAPKSDPSAQKLLNQVQALLKSGKQAAAYRTASKLVKAYPESLEAEEAYLVLATQHQKRSDPVKCKVLLESLIKRPYQLQSPYMAYSMLGDCSSASSDTEAAISAFELAQKVAKEPQHVLSVSAKLFKLYKERGQIGKSLISLKAAYEVAPESQKRNLLEAGLRTAEFQMTLPEISESEDSSLYPFLSPGYLRLSRWYLDQGNTSKARRYLQLTVEAYPESQYAEEASELLNQLSSRERVEPNRIGVILPLSGKYAKIGYKTLYGIQLALGIAPGEEGRSPYSLRIIDSEGNPGLARRGVERLVLEDKVIGIIGGLIGREAQEVASKSQELGVPVITLSQKAGLTQTGDYVFRNALTSEMQVAALVDLFISQLNKKKFALLFPNDAYGTEYSNLFWDEVLARGGEIRAAQIYDPKETDFRQGIQKLVGLYHKEDRADELKARLKIWNQAHNQAHGRKEIPNDILPPIVDFEVLFIPDSARAVGQIAPMLAYNDVQSVTLAGTSLWNTNDLIRRAGQFVEGSIFVDTFQANSDSFLNSPFSKRFKQSFGYAPDTFELRAYDSAMLIKNFVDRGATTRSRLKEELAGANGVKGAMFALKMSRNREVIRPLVALTIRNQKIVPQ